LDAGFGVSRMGEVDCAVPVGESLKVDLFRLRGNGESGVLWLGDYACRAALSGFRRMRKIVHFITFWWMARTSSSVRVSPNRTPGLPRFATATRNRSFALMSFAAAR